MGSTGSGSLSDYSGSTAGVGGGGSGVDRCQQAFATNLEEVAQCEYYDRFGEVPPPDQSLTLVFDERLFAINERGMKIGALPTSFNYLASCLLEGFEYVGAITTSLHEPIPAIHASFVPK